ncbi:MAG TPA: glycosyltransferase [Chitinispirillaceae bacterium]|nr:glycosyltransferase [Chitinispirillaceae bacterium]
MLLTILFLSVIVFLWYAAAIAILYRGLRRLSATTNNKPGNFSFSVLIAARNEEDNIGGCLRSILNQTISTDRYEIIVVDDRSEDRTASIVNEFIKNGAPVRLISVKEVPSGVVPKKNAISLAAQAACNEILVFTDADCVVLPSWIETIDRYCAPDTGFLQGITTYFNVPGMNPLFFGLQAVDFLSHGIVAAAGISAGIPINSNANNMVIRKDVFFELGGFSNGMERIVSADDDLLLQSVWRSKKWKVTFMADSAGAVTTRPTLTVRGVFDQRKRWGSNTAHYSPVQVLFLSGIFLFYCMIAAQLVFSVFDSRALYIFCALAGTKFVGELCLMLPGSALFGRKELRKYLLPASLIQLPVVVGAVVFGVFGTFSWKGQRFHRKLK